MYIIILYCSARCMSPGNTRGQERHRLKGRKVETNFSWRLLCFHSVRLAVAQKKKHKLLSADKIMPEPQRMMAQLKLT